MLVCSGFTEGIRQGSKLSRYGIVCHSLCFSLDFFYANGRGGQQLANVTYPDVRIIDRVICRFVRNMPTIVCIFTPPRTHHASFSRWISNISCEKDRGGEDAENVMRQSLWIAQLKSLSHTQDHTVTQAYSLFTKKETAGGGKRGKKEKKKEKGEGNKDCRWAYKMYIIYKKIPY
jgi:hypothetical protein